jgi:DNA-directed RNA polymerase specialized sigma24 family protein
MDAAESSRSHLDLSALSDKELVERLRENTKDVEVVRVLWDRHSETMHKALKGKVFGGLCPDGWDAETFLHQCESRGFVTFGQRMAVFGFDMSMKNWLQLIANSVALDELDLVKRQQREHDPRSSESEEGEDGEQAGEPADEDQMVLFRSTYVRVRSRHAETPLEHAAREERRTFLLQLISEVILDKDKDCATALRLRFWRDWSYSQIGRRLYGPSKSRRDENRIQKCVERLLDHDLEVIYPFCGHYASDVRG